MKKYNLILLICFSYFHYLSFSQNLPEGYILIYEQNFSAANALDNLRFSNPLTWKINKIKENRFLEFSSDSIYAPAFYSPRNMCILSNHIFGEFILEADIMQPEKEYENGDICIFFSVKDSIQYYYVQLANTADDYNHGIFLVKKDSCKKVSEQQNNGISLSDEKWHKVRIVRNIVNRSVLVYADDMSTPVMTSRNPELVMGYIGFGSLDDGGRIDNIKIWAPTSIPDEATFFNKKDIP
jgi:hypothetical protein